MSAVLPLHGNRRGLGPMPDIAGRRETARRYRDGMSLKAIADEDGISPMAVWHRLERAGVERRAPSMWCKPSADIIRSVVQSGSYAETGRVLGLSVHTVACRLNRRGISIKSVPLLRRLTLPQLDAYCEAIDVDRLQHEDALEIAREF